MKRTICGALALIAVAGTSQALTWDTIIDTGFENYTLGGLDGQFGWTHDSGVGDPTPLVIDSSSGPTLGNQAVLLEVSNLAGSFCEMDYAYSDVVAQGYKHLYVSYDIYRLSDATEQNLWWWLPDAGNPTYGLQWDQGGTYPHGWNPGASSATTVFGRYAKIEMEWDLETGLAYSKYDGNVVDNGIPITDIVSLSGWSIDLSHDAGDSNEGDKAYIDNFKILAAKPVPEPASLIALGTGLLLAIRRRRK